MQVYHEQLHGFDFIAMAKGYLEEEVERLFEGMKTLDPSHFKNHYAFQVGISIFFIKESDDNTYKILTVNYDKNPLKNLTEDLTRALKIEKKQREFMEDLGLEEVDSRYDDRIVVARDALTDKEFLLYRKEETYAAEEEWDVLRRGGDNKDFFPLYVFQLMEEFPDLERVMALPFEFSVLVKEGLVTEVWDRDKKVIWKNKA